MRLKDKLNLNKDLFEFCKVQLLTCEDILKLNTKDWRLKLKINIEYDLAYDKLYIGKWNEINEEYRRMFLVLSFLKAFFIVNNNQNHDFELMLIALHVLDVGVIIGSGLEEYYLLTEFAQLLHEQIGKLHTTLWS